MYSKIENQSLILVIDLDLIASNIEKIKNFLTNEFKIIANSNINNIIFNVKGIDVIDSLGVNLIIGLYKQTLTESKNFEIIGAGKSFMKVASFFRFTSLFSVKPE